MSGRAMEKTVLDCSYSSSISSSSETSEATSSDKFWKQYKRGRRQLSFWKIMKETLFPRNNKNYICFRKKLQAIDQFYMQFHQDYSEDPRNFENKQMNQEIRRATTLCNRNSNYMYYSSLV
jgi:hypothetical protein